MRGYSYGGLLVAVALFSGVGCASHDHYPPREREVYVEHRSPERPPPPRVVIVQQPPPECAVVVRESPPKYVEQDRGPRPSKGHVWVDGYWVRGREGWVWVSGRWEKPPKNQAVWAAPHWEQKGKEYHFKEGHWH